MPRRAKKSTFLGVNLPESYATIVLVGIIAVILGLLLANFLTNRNGDIGTGESTSTPQTEDTSRPPTETASGEYSIKENDSLSSIAKEVYGNEDYYLAIASTNKIQNPDLIYTDSKLSLPSKGDIEKIKTQLTITSYEVSEGETLFTIAEKVYGDGSLWMQIAKANNVGTLPNGNPLIFAGSTISIPR